MKTALALVLAVGFGFIAASVIVSRHQTARHAAELAEQQAAWQAEKSELEAALEDAKANPRVVTVRGASAPAPVAVPTKRSPSDTVAKLRGLRLGSGAGQTRLRRKAVYWLEDLIASGPAALPAIREFLARNEDVEFEFTGTNQVKSARGGAVPNEFVFPPSLRFGLFDVAKQIGGPEAEKLLAEILGTTGRGVEVAWLARALQESAPNQYRDVALNAARDLLGRSLAANSTSPLDRNDRDHLFSVLTMYGDNSYASTAQTQLLRADGQVDRSALKYLQQSLGQQAVAIAAQLYDDPRLADPAKKEPLARVALNYVGADAQADEFFQKAINDLNLPNDHRRNLIEDLNQDGFVDRKNLNARDLQLIQNRLALIEQLAPNATDPVNAAAFKEAYKDLLKMRERLTRPPVPPNHSPGIQ